MPRSGTTLTEQILASHSKVHGGGELDYVRNSLGINRIYDMSTNEVDKTIQRLVNFNDEDWKKIGDSYILSLIHI